MKKQPFVASASVALKEVKSRHDTQEDEQIRKLGRNPSLLSWLLSNREGGLAVACGISLFLAWIAGYFAPAISIVLYGLAYLSGGFYKAREGVVTLVKERDLDVNLLMILAALGAALIGYWAEGAMLIFIFALSGALETFTLAKSQQDISSLVGLNPEHAILFNDQEEVLVRVEELQVNDLILVKPGQRIPADGWIISGDSALDESTITGESIPVDKSVDDEVFAGTLNGQGSLVIKVSKKNDATLIAKVIRLVQEAQENVPAKQSFIERFEKIYAWVVIGVTTALITIPPLFFQTDWKDAFYKAMVFLVVASPCALVASIMPAILSAISNSSRKGILFKGGTHLETIAKAKVVAFDKTGTLTVGKPTIEDVIPYQTYSAEELLAITASIESLSTHPIAQAIVNRAQAQGLSLERPNDLQSVTGFGVEAQFKQDFWRIGKPAFIDSSLYTPDMSQLIQRLEEQGKTVIVVQNSAGVAGVLSLRDVIRPEAKSIIQRLKKLGIKTVMLTGDQQRTAEMIGKEAGLDSIYAGLLPENKGKIIQQLQEEYGAVLMIGDGVNDAPALALADVGIAMGGAGSDAALETADLVLMNDDLSKLDTVLTLGKKSRSVILQNVCFSLAVIMLLIAYNFFEGIPLPLGVVFHEGSTILVILNGLRLLR